MKNNAHYADIWDRIEDAISKEDHEAFTSINAANIVKSLIWKVSELETEIRILKNLQDAYEKKLYVQCLTDDRIKEYKEKLKRENGTS